MEDTNASSTPPAAKKLKLEANSPAVPAKKAECEANPTAAAVPPAAAAPSTRISKKRAIMRTIAFLLEESSDSDSDDDDDMLQRIQINLLKEAHLVCAKKNRNRAKFYLENIFASYTDEEFRYHFRISRNLFESLSEQFNESEAYKNEQNNVGLSAKIYLAVFLWFAGHEACSLSYLANRFDLPVTTICTIMRWTMQFIRSLSAKIIKWQNGEEKIVSSNFFKAKCGFSKAIGCIDGTHIRIVPPKDYPGDYMDKEGIPSLILLAVCNEKRKFTYVCAGLGGSNSDSWAFASASLSSNLPTLCEDYYILGDADFPCIKHLITPFKDTDEDLTDAQKLFNKKLNSGRRKIEQAFEMLKQRFRQLYNCKLGNVGGICQFILSCCVLHNMASEDDFNFTVNKNTEESDDESTNEEEEEYYYDESAEYVELEELDAGSEVRNSILAEL